MEKYGFGSGSSSYPEERNIVIEARCLEPGKNTILLESANTPETNHWLFWDSLTLKDPIGKGIWILGANEAPPDYSDSAFDEFDITPPYNSNFDVNSMAEGEFPAELNDSSFSKVYIHFNLTVLQANEDLSLFLDTLYATHTSASYFEVTVQTVSGN